MRLLFFIALLIGGVAAALWLAHPPGHIVINWGGYRIETSAALFVAVLVILMATTILVYRVLAGIFNLPGYWRQRIDMRRKKRGLDALWRGVSAAAAGDGPATEKHATLARRLLDRPPLAGLLLAQAASLKGDEDKALSHYAALAEDPQSRLVGLRGLAATAQRRGDWMAMRKALDEANRIEPKATWAIKGSLHLAAHESDWLQAIAILERAQKAKSMAPEILKQGLAAAWTAQARQWRDEGREDHDAEKALKAVRRAHKIDPGFAPAAALLSQWLGEKNAKFRAAAVIKKAWKIKPHPLLREAHNRLIAAQTPPMRLRKTHHLADLRPTDPESHLALAQAALATGQWDAAENHLARVGLDNPARETCLIMAQIEKPPPPQRHLVRTMAPTGRDIPPGRQLAMRKMCRTNPNLGPALWRMRRFCASEMA